MSPDQPFPALEALQAQLRGALDQQLAAVKQHYDDALIEARRQAVADAERATAASLDQARTEWESQLETAVAAARAEALQQAAEAAAAERADLERELQDRLTQHTESAAAQKADLERQMLQQLAQQAEAAAAQKAELERQMEQQLAQHTESAAAQKAQVAQMQQKLAQHVELAAAQRADLESQLQQKLSRHVEMAAGQKAELERQTQQKLDQHVEAAAAQKAELERQMQQRLDQHVEAAAAQKAELERQMQQKLDQHAESSAAERIELEQRLQQQMDQQVEQQVSAAQRTAQLELETERRRALNEIEAERERAKTELETLKDRAQADVAKARAAAAAAVAAALKATAAADAAAPSAAVTGAPALSQAASPLARVPLAIQELDATRTLSQALDSLLAHAGAIAGRAALFLINGDRLKVWKASGIPDVDVQTVESSIGAKDQLARAIQTGQSLASGPSLPAPPFARLAADRVGLAAPVMIGGRAIAVLYADTGAAPTPAPDGWQAAIDLIVRHAAALLALRTAMRTLDVLNGVDPTREETSPADHADEGVQGARRYARLLVSEIKLYNEAAVRDGRQQRDLLRRLRTEIERAQRLYEERIPPAVVSRQQYFQQELVQTLAEGDAALLGSA